jgi:predicted permease
LTLLIGAGLLVRSFLKLQAVDPGFRSDGVLALRISLPEVRYRESAQPGAFFMTLLDRLNAMPGVTAAGASTALPLRERGGSLVATIEGRPKPTKMSEFAFFSHRAVTPGYFAALGVPMLQGRDLAIDDRADRPRVAVINRTAARRYWPNDDAIGARISPDDDGGPAEIVGIVADMKGFGLGRETGPEMFISVLQPPPPLWRWTQRTMDVVVHMAGDPAQSAGPIRAIVRELDPTLPVYRVATLNEVVAESVGAPRRYVLLVTTFGAIALGLAALGIYGVMAFIVTARTQEIGVRVALGAARSDIMTLVLGRSLRFCAIGVGIGIAMALGMSRYIASLLFGITATDLTTYAVVSAILVAAAMLATWLPARRAMRVNPLIALRAD